MPDQWLRDALTATAAGLGVDYFLVKGLAAVLLVCLLCGMVGALVVGSRMAFFSDATAHCALAGISLGYLSLAVGAGTVEEARRAEVWVIPLVMVTFGTAIGVSIAFVRENTALANDTVIGVFFAFAIGLAAMLFTVLQYVSVAKPEQFLFGSPLFVPEADLIYLAALLLVTLVFFALRYNDVVFASFNPSLARTRRVPLRLNNYLFIVLLALVVNLSIKAVGALLINALLVVPAATAANLSRNLRQMFWLTIVLCVGAGVAGFVASYFVSIPVAGQRVPFGPSGTVVVVSVGLFFLSMAWAGLRARRPARPAA